MARKRITDIAATEGEPIRMETEDTPILDREDDGYCPAVPDRTPREVALIRQALDTFSLSRDSDRLISVDIGADELVTITLRDRDKPLYWRP